MTNIILLDDNPMITKSLRETISWEKENCCIVLSSDDGNAVLAAIEPDLPYVIITDIRMPLLDGFSFIERCKKRNASICFIIISGYPDFTYAQKAISLDVVEFISKPISNQEVISAVRKCKTLLKEKLLLENAKPIMDKYFIRQLISGQAISKTGHSLPSEKTCLLTIRCLPDTQADADTALQALTKLFSQKHIAYVQITFENDWCCVLYRYKDIFLLDKLLYNFSLKNETCFHIALSKEAKDIHDLPILYNENKAKLKRLFYETNTYIWNSVPNPDYVIINELENLRHSTNLSSWNKMTLSTWLEEFKTHRVPADICKEQVLHLLVDLSKYYKNESYLSYQIRLQTIASFSALVHCAMQIMDEIITLPEKNTSHLHQKIKEYLKSNYQEKISLQDLARYLNMNSSYISRIVNKEFGKSLPELVKEIRLENAARLLLTSNLKIYEICTAVGIENYAYFFQLFKEHYNLSPKEYREQFQKQ